MHGDVRCCWWAALVPSPRPSSGGSNKRSKDEGGELLLGVSMKLEHHNARDVGVHVLVASGPVVTVAGWQTG